MKTRKKNVKLYIYIYILSISQYINVLLDREATMWSQHSCLLWARDGDKNTKYLHSRATKRYRRNLIVDIRDDQDRWHDQSNA